MTYFHVPKYKVRPRPERFLFNRFLILIGLGILLYIAIFVNYYLIGKSIPTYMNWLFSVGILLLVILELIVCYIRYGNYVYDFFEKGIVINGSKVREILYKDIKHVRYSSNFIDRWFKTGSIVLELTDGKLVHLKYLDNPNQAFILMQKYIK